MGMDQNHFLYHIWGEGTSIYIHLPVISLVWGGDTIMKHEWKNMIYQSCLLHSGLLFLNIALRHQIWRIYSTKQNRTGMCFETKKCGFNNHKLYNQPTKDKKGTKRDETWSNISPLRVFYTDVYLNYLCFLFPTVLKNPSHFFRSASWDHRWEYLSDGLNMLKPVPVTTWHDVTRLSYKVPPKKWCLLVYNPPWSID